VQLRVTAHGFENRDEGQSLRIFLFVFQADSVAFCGIGEERSAQCQEHAARQVVQSDHNQQYAGGDHHTAGPR